METMSILYKEKEGLIFNVFEHSFEENRPIATVNASHFLPYKLSINKVKLGRVL